MGRELRLPPEQENALERLRDQYAELAAFQERKDRSFLARKAADALLPRRPQDARAGRLRAALCCALCAAFVLCAGCFAVIRAPKTARPAPSGWTADPARSAPSRAMPQPAEEAPGRKVFINLATEEELQTLSGIGPALAERIVRERENNGFFYLPEDLAAVPGIGEKTVERLRPFISFELKETEEP